MSPCILIDRVARDHTGDDRDTPYSLRSLALYGNLLSGLGTVAGTDPTRYFTEVGEENPDLHI